MSVGMVDTNIVLLSNSVRTEREGPEVDRMRRASKALLTRLHSTGLRMAAATWYELFRRSTETQRTALVRAFRTIDVLPLTPAAAECAADLIKRKNRPEKFCERCLNPIPAVPCALCKAQKSKAQNVFDSLIVGIAETAREVEVLYTFDNGLLAYKSFVSRVVIREPPQEDGAIFDGVPLTPRETVQPVETPGANAQDE